MIPLAASSAYCWHLDPAPAYVFKVPLASSGRQAQVNSALGLPMENLGGMRAGRAHEKRRRASQNQSIAETVFPEDSLADSRPSCASPLDHSAQNFSESLPPPRASLSPSAMTTPTQPQTPVSTPPVPHGVGNPGGTPVVAPTRSKDKDGAASGTLGTFGVKSGLAQMLKGGVIMDVVNAEQARIAEEAGACAVMALERVPADIRATGGVARMSDPSMIKQIVDAVTIPVMAKVRIGHFVEAQILQAIGIDYIDESEVLTPADEEHHINKHPFKVPFVCGARNLGEALRRISEGAAFIRTKGEAGTGNVVEAVRHQRSVMSEIRKASVLSEEELYSYAKEIQAPFHLLKETARLKRLPVVNFAAGGIATPADAALMMQLGCDGVFVGSGIFHSDNPAKRARAIVQSVTHYNNPKILAEISEDLGPAMVGLTIDDNLKGGRLAGRGW